MSGLLIFLPLSVVICVACLRPVSCVAHVASVCGLSILDFTFGFHKRLLKCYRADQVLLV